LLGILVWGWAGAGVAGEAPLPPSKDPQRQFEVAKAYASGSGMDQNWEKAVYWYRRAAEQGHVRAQLQMGIAYQKGRGVERDNAVAVEWFRRAAEEGTQSKAMLELGTAYRDGKGVEKDPVTAMMWFNLSSKRGGLASRIVGPGYARGLSKEDRVKAREMADEWLAQYAPELLEKESDAEAADGEDATAGEEPAPEAPATAPADPPPA